MSENKIIKETKIFKHEIESPKIYSQDIIIGGIHISKTIFDGQIMPRKLYSLDQIRNTSTVTGKKAEQVVGFDFPVTESLRKNIIRSITVNRNDNSGTATGLKQKVYMFIDSYDENNQLLQTVFSIEPVQQVQSDVLATKWQFNEYLVKHKCSRLKVGFSTTLGERQTDCTVRSCAYLHYNEEKNADEKIYVNGWNSYYPKDGSKQEYTTQFIVDYDYVVSGIQSHIDDDSVHLSPEEHQAIEAITVFSDHLKNTDVHLSSEEKTILQNFDTSVESVIESSELRQEFDTHKTTDNLHWSDDDRTFKTNTENHIKNGSLHLTTAQKNQIIQNLESMQIHINNSNIHITKEEKDIISSLINVNTKETTRNTKDVFAKDGTGSAARLHAWDMKTAEYVGEYLTQVTIYRPTNIAYIDSSDILHNNPQWLSVECLDVNGNLLGTYFSNDKDSQKDGEDNTTTWNFDEIKIKEEYHKLRFRVTTQENVLENQPQSMKRAILCYTYTNIPDTNDWGVIEQNNTVQAGHTMYFQFKTITKKLSIESHIEDSSIHLSADEKTEISKITPLKTLVDSHIGDATHVTQEEKDKISSLIDAISVETIQHNIDTRQLLPSYTGLGNESIVGFTMTVDQSYKGIVVDELDLRRNDNTNLNGNNLYIYAQCFNSNDEQINVFYSTNTDTQTSGDDKIMTWTFDDFVIPNECSSIKFYYTTVKGQKQTNVNVRTAKLLQNGTALYKDGWKTIWQNETYKTFTTDFAIRGHETKIDKIIELETLLDNHKGDDTHLTADQKNFIQTISSSFIETEQFTSKQDGMTITEKASCKYFDISKKHFISGVSNKIKLLKKIEIPYLSGGSVYNDVHLCIQFYKNSSEQKTLEDCIFSTNIQNQTNSNGLLSFEFADVEIPEDYLFMRVYLSSDTTSIPDGTISLRITPLKTNSLTFDDDECRVIGSNGTEYNWLVYLNAQTEEKFGYQNYKMLLQKVFDLSELVKSLQEELEELKGNTSN